MAQSQQVANMITARTGRTVELTGMSTEGDLRTEHLTQLGGTGVFVSALRQGLIAGQIDLAVHSLKDLPAGPAAGLTLAAIPPRDDPRDALVAASGAKLADLPAGARIGTGSPRRAAQLLLLRPDLRPVPIRGNAGTRLARVGSGDLDAVVLAYAGLARIGRLDAISQVFEIDEIVPAPGQGALAAECLSSRADVAEALASVDDPVSRAVVTAERALLNELEAGCSAPIGAYAAGTDTLRLEAIVTAVDGGWVIRANADGPASEAVRLGRQVAIELLSRGAERHMGVSAGHPSDGNGTK